MVNDNDNYSGDYADFDGEMVERDIEIGRGTTNFVLDIQKIGEEKGIKRSVILKDGKRSL